MLLPRRPVSLKIGHQIQIQNAILTPCPLLPPPLPAYRNRGGGGDGSLGSSA